MKDRNCTILASGEAEDWFRPIDLAKECGGYLYFHLEAITQRNLRHFCLWICNAESPWKIGHKNFKPSKIKRANYPLYHLVRENKNLLDICGDPSHLMHVLRLVRSAVLKNLKRIYRSYIRFTRNKTWNTFDTESENKIDGENARNFTHANIFVENRSPHCSFD
ncbi:hypothetical protein TNCV_275051 [Trichonephila clavipes]|nr:hypothetical protein TNCV_275051 [Trichonephila clavipes]